MRLGFSCRFRHACGCNNRPLRSSDLHDSPRQRVSQSTRAYGEQRRCGMCDCALRTGLRIGQNVIHTLVAVSLHARFPGSAPARQSFRLAGAEVKMHKQAVQHETRSDAQILRRATNPTPQQTLRSALGSTFYERQSESSPRSRIPGIMLLRLRSSALLVSSDTCGEVCIPACNEST